MTLAPQPSTASNMLARIVTAYAIAGTIAALAFIAYAIATTPELIEAMQLLISEEL